MNFKGWFKNEKAKQEASALEKIAQDRLRGQSADYLEALPSEIAPALFQETVDALFHSLDQEYTHLVEKQEAIDQLKTNIFGLKKEIETQKQIVHQGAPVVFARQDEFYSEPFSITEQQVAELEKEYHRMMNKLEIEESEYAETKQLYEQGLIQYYTLTHSSEISPEEQQRIREGN